MWNTRQPELITRPETHHGREITCLTERPASLHDMLASAANAHPNAPALIGVEGTLTHAALQTRAMQIAGGLKKLGLTKGDRVALLMGNRFAFVETLAACFAAGLICVPINPLQRAPEMAFALNQCSAAAIIFDADFTTNIPETTDIPTVKHRIAAYGNAPNSLPFETLLSEPITPTTANEDDTAVLLYTSGTTGRPKGACLTHLSIIHASLQFAAANAIDAQSRMLLAAPASHVTGLVACITSTLAVSGAVVLMGAFKAADALAEIERNAITHTMGPPAIYALMLLAPTFDSTNKTSWRIGGFGGSPMLEATIKDLANRAPKLGLMNGYGATEATGPFTTLPAEKTATHSASVGHPLHCCEISIRNEEGQELPIGQSGEIWKKGPNVIPGYWDNPEANALNFTDGWWKSGDLGRMDAEGHVTVHDRKKDMLNRGGYKIYSAEVENQLSFHPAILECAVIAKPCPVLGERVRLIAVTTEPPSETLESDIIAFATKRLSKYKIPEDVIFRTDPLPRNPNGKIMKATLREDYA